MGTKQAIVCDMRGAADTLEQRLEAYRQLFADALVGREHRGDEILFRFTAAPGVEERVRDLAAREKACCAFYEFQLSVADGEVLWQASVVDDPVALQVLDEFYRLPDALGADVSTMLDRLEEAGLELIATGDGRRVDPG